MVESVDTGDLKSPGSNSLAGSSPALGIEESTTEKEKGVTGSPGMVAPFSFFGQGGNGWRCCPESTG